MTIEMKLLLWSLVLALVQIVLAATSATKDVGLPYAATARDVPPERPTTIVTGRLIRAQRNLFETLPIFIALVLIAAAQNVHSSMTANGAMLYFWGRVVYLPLYLFGIPYARTVVWFASVAGLVMLICALLCHGA